ncbi:MAG TPA: hypothetical protein VLI06_16645 [Solimonas sp.]|nr:hypothetical protein [Solimonas sp.]
MFPHFAFSDFPKRVRRLPQLPSGARNGTPRGRSPVRLRPQLSEAIDLGEYLPAYATLLTRYFGQS